MQPESEVGSETRLWLEGMAAKAPAGCFVEVGVYKGGTAWHLAKVARAQGRPLFLYDTFCGMPFSDEGDSHKVGDFGATSLEMVQKAIPDAICVPGVFPASLVDMPPVAFAHIDCDQFRSITDCVRELFFKRMVPGGIMVFDDYPFLPAAVRAVEGIFGPGALLPPDRNLPPHTKAYAVK